MNEIHFRCEAELFGTYPELAVYALRVRGMRAALAAGDAGHVLAEAIQSCTVDPEKVAEEPMVAAWREAYGRMGVKPSKFRSSVEALLRRASKRADLALPVPSVNLYNACSIVHRAALGAYDVARLPTHTIELRRARPSIDRFEPLGAEASAFPLTPGLVVYGSGDEVLCWGFNARDSRVAALEETSEEGIFFAEAASHSQEAPARAALSMLRETFSSWGAACSAIAGASRTTPHFSL
jgi:lysyl-tRNA synthetase class 2